MNKVHSLRDHLTTHFGWLAANPQAISVFVKGGTFGDVLSEPGEPLHIGYAYTARILLIDFAGDMREFTAVLWDWINRHQEDVAQNPQRRAMVRFEVELLDNALADVQIDLPLTEHAKFTPRPGGGFEVEDGQEPQWEAPHYPAGWGVTVDGQIIRPFPSTDDPGER
ncbi:phage tail protein [Lysobacter brunescens]|uniref:Phage tail protein n=1 Tax=Lysobacter brunescens TaxID=262323 RepID=A0ABW2YEL0_9GAMM